MGARSRNLYIVVALFVLLAHTCHIRFRSRSPRSHVKPMAAVYISPKRQVSCAFNTLPIALWSTIRTMRAEIRGRSGTRIMVTPRGLPPVSRIPSLNLNVYALRGGDAARYNAPTSDARRHSHLSTLVFESRWESDAREITRMAQYRRFTEETAFIGGMRRTGRLNWNFVGNVYLFMEI